MINTLEKINTKTDEGKLLIGALAELTTVTHTDKTPDEVIEICNKRISDIDWSE